MCKRVGRPLTPFNALDGIRLPKWPMAKPMAFYLDVILSDVTTAGVSTVTERAISRRHRHVPARNETGSKNEMRKK